MRLQDQGLLPSAPDGDRLRVSRAAGAVALHRRAGGTGKIRHTLDDVGVCPLLIFWISRMVLVAARGTMQDNCLVWALNNRTSRSVLIVLAVVL